MIRHLPRLIVSALACLVLCGAAFAQAPPTGDSIKNTAIYLGPNHEYSKPVASWKDLKSLNVVMQQHEYSCGAASLATLLKNCFDGHIDEKTILDASLSKLSKKDLADRQKNGLSMEDLANGASRLHYAAAVLEVKYEKLRTLKMPVIVRLEHDEFKHFVVFRGELGDRVFLADPLRGNIRMAVDPFRDQWDGKILAVVTPGRKPAANSPLAIQPWQTVTPEVEAARQAIVGAPLPPVWFARPRTF